ncbi:MAG: methylmalonyl-CoA mutase small subunit, partial [Draconibacterium sp.]
MAEKEQKLFTDFSPTTTEAWEEKIQADLKGRDYQRALVWRTKEGFNVQPYYRKEELQNINHLGSYPGEFPFVRGTKTNNNDWFIRQDIEVNSNDLKATNKKILDVLQKGITSIGLNVSCKTNITDAFLAELLHKICLDAIETNFKVCVNNLDNVEAISKF